MGGFSIAVLTQALHALQERHGPHRPDQEELEWVPLCWVRLAPILADCRKSHSSRTQNGGDSKCLFAYWYSHRRRAQWKIWPIFTISCSWRARIQRWRGTLKQWANTEKCTSIEKRSVQIPACSEDTVKCVSCLYPSVVAWYFPKIFET